MILNSIIKKATRNRDSSPKRAEQDGAVPDSEGIYGFIVEQDRMITEISRLEKVVKGEFVHSTHLPDICPRQIALIRYTKDSFIHSNQFVGSNDRLVWATGRAFEEHIRTQFINKVGKHAVAGDFTCACGAMRVGKNLKGHQIGDYSDDKCNVCGTYQDTYDEIAVLMKDSGTSHGIDLPYFNAKGQTVVAEIKSIKKGVKGKKSTGGFANLTEPQAANLRQVFMYHKIAEKSGAYVAPYVVVFYACKEHLGPKATPYKEFKVRVDDPKYRHLYDINEEYLEKGKEIKMINKSGVVSSKYDCGDGFPARRCPKSTCATARGCQVQGLCYSLGDKE